MPLDPRRIEVIDDKTAELLRRMTPAQKLAQLDSMVSDAREMITCVLRSQHPEWTREHLLAEVRRRISHGAA